MCKLHCATVSPHQASGLDKRRPMSADIRYNGTCSATYPSARQVSESLLHTQSHRRGAETRQGLT